MHFQSQNIEAALVAAASVLTPVRACIGISGQVGSGLATLGWLQVLDGNDKVCSGDISSGDKNLGMC